MTRNTVLTGTFGLLILACSPVPASAQSSGTWEVQTSGVEDHLNDVTFVGPRDGWAVGGHNTILHTADGGRTWERQVKRQDKGPTFHRVLFTGPKTGWACTEILGTILHTADGGTTWKDVPLPHPKAAGVSYSEVAAVGDEFVLQYSKFVFRTADAGRTWNEQTDMFPADSQAKGGMWFADTSHGCAVWKAGRLAVTADGGRTWTEGRLGGKEAAGNYTLTQFADPKTGWALPEHGTIHATTDGGKTWAPQDLGPDTPGTLVALHFTDARLGYVLGLGRKVVGEMRRTVDGGKTWELLGKLRNPSYVHGLSFPDKDHGWVVGDKGYIEHYRGPGVK
jgi:photosystem II stability/assembly factor-like uncharacterized protein